MSEEKKETKPKEKEETVKENGQVSRSFSASTIRAALRSQGLTGKDLTAAVNAALRDATPTIAGRSSALTAAGMLVKSERAGTRADGRAFYSVTLEDEWGIEASTVAYGLVDPRIRSK